ncbi:hypothetical protein Moror_5072 [Moniliophthora roreri MCA 2997]|uniref:F-box domain-containing protein n=1 Tax=Moniliophthora roreri (strain MCA 2997) TaxID=1381753 RepID=V2WHI9_MONRO|nr:hypothetical protein Moror_5072 [Moniliophthora roreri MCA 2997]
MGKSKKRSGGPKTQNGREAQGPAIKSSSLSTVFCPKCNNEFTFVSYPLLDPKHERRLGRLPVAQLAQAITSLKDEERELIRFDEEITRFRGAIAKLESEKLAYEERDRPNGMASKKSSRTLLCQRCNGDLDPFSDSPKIQGKPLYDDQISVLRQVIAKVEAEKPRLQQRISVRRDAISLSQRRGLPAAIWRSIFSKVICNPNGAEDSVTIPVFTSPVQPLILSQICSDWRVITHSMPELWRTISVFLGFLSKDWTMLIALFLKNSNGVPLRVRFYDTHSTGLHLLGHQQRFGRTSIRAFILLMTQASRLEKLHVSLFDWEILTHWQQKSISFPVLREFSALGLAELSNQDIFERPSLTWFWDAIRSAPKLYSWTTDRATADVLRLVPHNGLGQEPKFEGGKIRPVLQLLQSTRVTGLMIEGLTEDIEEFKEGGNGSQRQGRVQAQFVDDIAIGISDVSSANVLFSFLVVPRLKSLAMRVAGPKPKHSDWTVPSTLAAMLSRSTWLLSDLTINIPVIYFSDRTLEKILRAVPYLKTLCLISLHQNPRGTVQSPFNLFTTLKIGPNDSAHSLLVPRLEELVLAENELFFPDPHNAEALLQALEFRSRSRLAAAGRTQNDIAALRRVKISSTCRGADSPTRGCKLRVQCRCNHLYKKPFDERINALRQDGMTIELGTKFETRASSGATYIF